MSLPTCPKCQQTDQVQKVTSVFAANTKEWKESSTGIDSWGNTVTTEHLKNAHTSLGVKLKPPQEVSGPTHPGLWYGIGGIVTAVLGCFLCSFATVPFSFVIPIVTGSAFIPDIAGVPAWGITFLVIVLPTLCIGIFGLGLMFWLGSKIKKRWGRDMHAYHEKKAAFERDELPRWQGAKARWEQLHYCLRDETLFIPAENIAITVDDMEKYLYNPMFRS